MSRESGDYSRISTRRFPGSWLGWCLVWFGLAAAIITAGALIGAVVFPLAGSLLHMDLSIQEMVVNGVFDGGFLALIWAPGVSFVACLMIANHRRRERGRDG